MARTSDKPGEKDDAKSATKKTPAKAATAKATSPKEKPAKAPGAARGGIAAPVTPSDDLAEIVGKDKLPRSEVVKKMWDYIKSNDLQNPKDKREILADAKLEKIFGGKKATMFEMNKHLAKHLK